MTNHEAYYSWSNQQTGLPLFMQGWWMDAVCVGKEWTTATLPSGAMMPVLLRKKAGLRFVLMPQQTQIGGYYGQADSAKDLIAAIDSLHADYYYQKYPLSATPLIEEWRKELETAGFRLQEMVTYRIEDLSDIDALAARFSENKRRQLKKATDLTVDWTLSEEEMYHFHEECLQKREKSISYSAELWHSLYEACQKHKAGQLVALRTAEGQLAAAAFLVYDADTCYYLIPTYDPSLGNNGAGARLVQESLRWAASHSRAFDFEGSMIPSVAEHYRQFGATATRYYALERCSNPLCRIALRVYRWITRKKQ